MFGTSKTLSEIPISSRHLTESHIGSATRVAREEGPSPVTGKDGVPTDGPAVMSHPRAENKTGRGPHTFHKDESTIKPTSGMQSYETPRGEDRRKRR